MASDRTVLVDLREQIAADVTRWHSQHPATGDKQMGMILAYALTLFERVGGGALNIGRAGCIGDIRVNSPHQRMQSGDDAFIACSLNQRLGHIGNAAVGFREPSFAQKHLRRQAIIRR